MEEQEYDIFISYSKKDKSAVYGYYDRLQEAGYNVWLDKDGLGIGVDYSSKIVGAIKQSKVFLFFSSDNSNASAWTQGEVIAAHNFGKTIIPVILDGSPFAENIMLLMLPLNSIDCTQSSMDAVCVKLLSTLNGLIGPGKGLAAMKPESKLDVTRLLKTYFIVAIVLSLVFSNFWMMCSGEYELNLSLSLFTAFIGTLVSSYASYCAITKVDGWNKRHLLTNIALLFGFVFFLTYAIMAIGLGFIDMNIMLLNITSSVCAAYTCYVFIMLMKHKKKGYRLLWLCALVFCIGSIVWTGLDEICIVVCVATVMLMVIFTSLLLLKKNSVSTWDLLQ